MFLPSLSLALFFSLASPSEPQWFKKSVITLTDMSEVPGMVIEPGVYILKADETSGSDRLEVQLLNKDESQILTKFMAVPDHRQRPEGDTIVTFFEGVTSGPRPIQTWFYVGEMNGYEFVYPPHRAKEIAKQTNDHVMAAESTDGDVIAITSSGTEVVVFESKSKLAKKAAVTEEPKREKPQPNTATKSKKPRTTRGKP